MVNRFLFLIMAGGLLMAGWSSWQMFSGTGGVIQDKDRAQAISENWDDTRYSEVYNETTSVDQKSSENETVAEENSLDEVKEYDYEKGEQVGELVIPKLERIYEIYWGTDDDTLDQGVGYHDSDFTTPPDGMRHTVLSGHRDTVFRKLGELEDGDRFYMKFEEKEYEYQIRKTWITDADDRTVIVDKETPTLTLTTCYPFEYLGAAPDRYIIQAELIGVKDTIQ